MSSITIVSDAPNCGVTYDRCYDDRNSFIIQVTDMFCNYCLWKKCIIANKSAATDAREKISTDLESPEQGKFHIKFSIFKNNQILLNKISHELVVSIITICGFCTTGWLV